MIVAVALMHLCVPAPASTPARTGRAPGATAQEARDARRSGEPHDFLRTVCGFSAAELAALDRGESIARVLDTDKREVAVAGAVRVKGPRERLFAQYRDVSGLRRSQVFQEVGTFSAPPRAEDLRSLTFEDYDLETVRRCTPGDCGVRLSAENMARLQRDVNWSAADWRQQAGALWRQLLAADASAYQARGSRALAIYQNKEVPLNVAQEFQVLFNESQYFKLTAPGFFRYLEDYPDVPLEGAESILYWAKESFGLRPVMSLTHLALYSLPPGRASTSPSAFIATKQIYATHYFDAVLGLSLVFDDHASGFYMLSINRARTRSLTSFLRGFVRSTVQTRSRQALEQILRSTKASVEQSRAK
jgi:hypothetical protein